MTAGDVTSLRLSHDWRSGGFDLRLAKEWDRAIDFSRYTRDFQVDQVPCREPRALGDSEARALLEKHGAAAALSRAEELMRAGRHEMIVMRAHAALGIRTCNNVHSSVLGRNNGYHAIRAGGIRRHEPGEPEAEVLVDGLNLGRAMSFKNAAAQIPFGGNKMTVRCEPVSLDDEARLGFLAFCIDAGHFMTGPDMGFPPELSDALRSRFTHNIMGGPGGSMGPTGTPTARGCFLAIQEAARVAWGGDVRDRTVAVQGLGAVGLPLAKLLADAGAKLIVADPDPAPIDELKKDVTSLEVVAPSDVLSVECDLLSPCAFGAVLNEASIDALRCQAVYGSANNQLEAVSQSRELELAERLSARGILYQPDWTHNTAGVIAGYEEYVHQADAKMERVMPHLERVCRDGTRSLLAEAAEAGRTPTAIAYERIERQIYPPSPGG